MISSDLFADNLVQHPLPAPAVKLTGEDSLPRAKDFGELGEAVEPTLGDGNDHPAAHDLPLQVGVGIVPSAALGTGACPR